MRHFLLCTAAAFSMFGLGAASGHAATYSNSPTGNSIFSFGTPDTQTYGEVFTAQVSGTLTSFTLSLNDGVSSLYGAVGAWNGPSTFASGYGVSADLYQSANVSSSGAASYTFSPNISVVAGQQYVAYLSVYGDMDASGTTGMPLGSSELGIDYFVFNNSSDPHSNPSWNYDFSRGDALFSYDISAVPLPASLPMFGGALLAVAGLGFAAKWKRQAKTVA